MEQAKDQLEISLALLTQATVSLEIALKEKLTEFIRDAVIQRFEYTFELAWKTVKTAADYLGTSVITPREAIQFSYKMQWIGNPDDWFDAMKARNSSSHMYQEKIAIEVYDIAKDFPAKVTQLLKALKKI